MVAGSLLLFIYNFARLLSRHGRQQREFLAGAHLRPVRLNVPRV